MKGNIFALIAASAVFGFMIFGISSVVFAESANLLFKIDNPGLTRDLFGSSVSYVDGKILVGASDKNIGDVAYAGSIYVFDGKTGSLLYTIDNPEPTLGDRFGLYVATSQNNIVASIPIDNSGDSATKGMIYVFDGKTGSLLYTIKNPREDKADEWFGRHIATIGDNIIANSIFEDPASGKSTAVIYVFDGKTGSLLHMITNPKSESEQMFFSNIASVGNYIVTGSYDENPNDDKYTNVMLVFDGTTGSLVHTITNPEQEREVFGRIMIGTNDKILVGTPELEVNDRFVGAIYVFDAKTGDYLYSISNPEKDNTIFMGSDIDTFGNNIVASAQVSNLDGNDPNNVVYVFDGDTGSHLYTITDPEPNNGNELGSVITPMGENIAVSVHNQYSFVPQKNTIYVFGNTSEIAGSLSDYLIAAAIVAGAIISGVFLLKRSRSTKIQNPELAPKIE